MIVDVYKFPTYPIKSTFFSHNSSTQHNYTVTSIRMDKLPNELQEMVASHVSVKDLRSYRLVNRRFELIANRLLFDTVLF